MEKKKKTLLALAAAGIALAAGYVYLTAPGKPSRQQKSIYNGRNIAHRGLHTRDHVVPENSLAAFEAAASVGYGIELDVRLTKDGQVVVFHDDNLKRVCGVDARVDEMTYAELQQLRLYDTDQIIPLFSQVLTCVRGRGPLIVEIKTGKHNKELCEKTCELLRCYAGDYCIESFNPMILRWFRRNAPDIMRGQLASQREDYKGEVNAVTGFALSRLLLNFIGRPQFIAYRIGKKPLSVRFVELLGALKVGWTSHEWVNEADYDTVIFEYYHPNVTYK